MLVPDPGMPCSGRHRQCDAPHLTVMSLQALARLAEGLDTYDREIDEIANDLRCRVRELFAENDTCHTGRADPPLWERINHDDGSGFAQINQCGHVGHTWRDTCDRHRERWLERRSHMVHRVAPRKMNHMIPFPEPVLRPSPPPIEHVHASPFSRQWGAGRDQITSQKQTQNRS